MNFKFTKVEVESKMNDCLKYGDETKIAERLDKSPGFISQMLNVNDERESDFYKAIKFVCAQIDNNECRGLELLQLFNLMCERHLTQKAFDCPTRATSDFMQQFTEAMQARIEGKPKAIQIKEIDDCIRQGNTLKDAILRT